MTMRYNPQKSETHFKSWIVCEIPGISSTLLDSTNRPIWRDDFSACVLSDWTFLPIIFTSVCLSVWSKATTGLSVWGISCFEKYDVEACFSFLSMFYYHHCDEEEWKGSLIHVSLWKNCTWRTPPELILCKFLRSLWCFNSAFLLSFSSWNSLIKCSLISWIISTLFLPRKITVKVIYFWLF